jgi:ligand-binding SRPBCC domain-containing protein
LKTIKLYTEINASPEICFDLSRSVEIHLISTAETNERVVAGRNAGLCEKGDSITWRARHLGIMQNLTVNISELNYPTHFQDKMVKGAFGFFTHDHYFEHYNSTTLMKDVFRFAAPLGPLGWLAESLFLEKYMRDLLVKRNDVIKSIAESDQWREVLQRNA